MRTCRLCLYKGDERQVMSVFDNNNVKDLVIKISDCVSINISENDKLPTSACLSCIHQVTQWVTFKETCQKSNKILLKTYNDLSDPFLSNVNFEFNSIKPEGVWNAGYKYNKHKNDRNNIERAHISQRRLHLKQYKSTDESDSNTEDDKKELFDEDYYDLDEYKIDIPLNTYACDMCMDVFNDCLDYLDHQEAHNGQPVFKCDKCSKIFSYRKDLVEHDKNHRNPCPQCGKMILKSSMKLHLIKHTDRYMCKQCSGRFNSKAILSQHIITVHTDIKDHICETCGKRFSSQTAMRVHMKSHSDERLYPCKLCNYSGRTASAIYVHMSTHANDLCVCEVCSKTFKSNRNLNDHLRRVHSKEKKHECTYCDKKFVDKYMLRVHVRCHTGVRPYQCSLCEKAFIRSDGLKEHMATHGQRAMHDCKNCGKKFTSKRGITRHTCNSVL